MSKVTLRVIANETGLSKFAVSRALSGKEGVSDATRARIIDVAKRMGYSRATKPTVSTLGAVFSAHDHANSEMNMQIQNGLQREAQRLGYTIQAHWVTEDEELGDFIEGCAGFFAKSLSQCRALEAMLATGKPIVRSGWIEPLDQVDSVGGTDHDAGVAVARYLLKLGHREVVYVHGPIDLRGRRERFHGLRDGLSEADGTICHDMVWDEKTSFTGELNRLLAAGANPTAFFCAHDEFALTAVTDILSRGWRIPKDVSVVGFGDFSAARQISPPLTTIKIPGEDFGRLAVRQLDTRLRLVDPFGPPIRMLIPNRFIERASTGPVREDVAELSATVKSA